MLQCREVQKLRNGVGSADMDEVLPILEDLRRLRWLLDNPFDTVPVVVMPLWAKPYVEADDALRNLQIRYLEVPL